jgi:hypothetical protein
MNNFYSEAQPSQTSSSISWGHFGIIMMAIVLVVGMSWMEKPDLFDFHKASELALAQQNAPHYYAYVPPASDQQPEVLGASTNPTGPSIINDDGTVSPVDMGQILGASTQDVQLSLDSVKVNQVPDSNEAITEYFTKAKVLEISPVDTAAFQSALTSNDQAQINQQAQKLIGVRDSLQKLLVPQGLVKLQQLKIIQYSSAIILLQNFSQADNNPTLVDQNLMQFIKSQQDLDTENVSVAQKYGSLDPSSSLYVDSSGQPLQQAQAVNNLTTSDNSQNSLSTFNNSDASQ